MMGEEEMWLLLLQEWEFKIFEVVVDREFEFKIILRFWSIERVRGPIGVGS